LFVFDKTPHSVPKCVKKGIGPKMGFGQNVSKRGLGLDGISVPCQVNLSSMPCRLYAYNLSSMPCRWPSLDPPVSWIRDGRQQGVINSSKMTVNCVLLMYYLIPKFRKFSPLRKSPFSFEVRLKMEPTKSWIGFIVFVVFVIVVFFSIGDATYVDESKKSLSSHVNSTGEFHDQGGAKWIVS
jgi:hypothetical protein